jgi:hypothetical protein
VKKTKRAKAEEAILAWADKLGVDKVTANINFSKEMLFIRTHSDTLQDELKKYIFGETDINPLEDIRSKYDAIEQKRQEKIQNLDKKIEKIYRNY